MSNLEYFLADASKLNFIVALIQYNVKYRFFVKLDIRYGGYFPEYWKYLGRPLMLNNSMYVMTKCGKLLACGITNFLMNVRGSKQSQLKISTY